LKRREGEVLEDAMFEEELELEKKSSSIIPLLLIVTLIVGIAGVSLYFVMESRKVLTAAEASPVLLASIEGQPPATLHFTTGLLDPDEQKPQYRLLENEGYLKISKQTKSKIPVALTPKGESWLAEIPGVKKSSKEDQNEEYAVPLAQRKLVEIGKITMLSPSKAAVEYTWKWDTTKAGDLFDAAGPAVKTFNTWDRTTLIEKCGAAFYHEGPKKVTVMLAKGDNGWGISRE
jgi:flagellar basal body-associated protein FliL